MLFEIRAVCRLCLLYLCIYLCNLGILRLSIRNVREDKFDARILGKLDKFYARYVVWPVSMCAQIVVHVSGTITEGQQWAHACNLEEVGLVNNRRTCSFQFCFGLLQSGAAC